MKAKVAQLCLTLFGCMCELRFIWDKMRSIAQKAAFQIAEKLLQRGKREVQYIYYFGEARVHAIKYFLFFFPLHKRFMLVVKSSCYHKGAVIIMKDF